MSTVDGIVRAHLQQRETLAGCALRACILSRLKRAVNGGYWHVECFLVYEPPTSYRMKDRGELMRHYFTMYLPCIKVKLRWRYV